MGRGEVEGGMTLLENDFSGESSDDTYKIHSLYVVSLQLCSYLHFSIHNMFKAHGASNLRPKIIDKNLDMKGLNVWSVQV